MISLNFILATTPRRRLNLRNIENKWNNQRNIDVLMKSQTRCTWMLFFNLPRRRRIQRQMSIQQHWIELARLECVAAYFYFKTTEKKHRGNIFVATDLFTNSMIIRRVIFFFSLKFDRVCETQFQESCSWFILIHLQLHTCNMIVCQCEHSQLNSITYEIDCGSHGHLWWLRNESFCRLSILCRVA